MIAPRAAGRRARSTSSPRRMRQPGQRRADLRAQLAANRTGARRLEDLAERRRRLAARGDRRDARLRRAPHPRLPGRPAGRHRRATTCSRPARRPRAAPGRDGAGRRADPRLRGQRRPARRQPQLPAGRHALGLPVRPARPHRPGHPAERRRAPPAVRARARGRPAQRAPRRGGRRRQRGDVVPGGRPRPRRVRPRARPGTMNNLTLGNERFTYYETLGGGQGACPDADGPTGVHVAMSNTLNTPVEALELEFPLRVVRYARRRARWRRPLPRRRRRRARGRGAGGDELLAHHGAPPARAARCRRRRAGRPRAQPARRRGARAQGLGHPAPRRAPDTRDARRRRARPSSGGGPPRMPPWRAWVSWGWGSWARPWPRACAAPATS